MNEMIIQQWKMQMPSGIVYLFPLGIVPSHKLFNAVLAIEAKADMLQPSQILLNTNLPTPKHIKESEAQK